jgi:hypothetical protein
VLLEQAGRITALAIRLERHRGSWRVVELTSPEAGLAPLATRVVHPWSDTAPPTDVASQLTG